MNDLKGFVWGPINAEDLAPVPESNWVITSGMLGPCVGQGRLYAIDTRDFSCNEIYPYDASDALDEERFGPVELLDPLRFEPHGIDVARRVDGVSEVYVVNHGWRETIEVFEVVLGGLRPSLRWIGAAVLPEAAIGNDVAALSGGGFVVSVNEASRGGIAQGVGDTDEPRVTGRVLEWSSATGWRTLPGTDILSANGVAASTDGQWVYVAGWRSRCIKKVRRGGLSTDFQVVDTGILTDNLTWTSDGWLLAAGAFDTTAEDFLARHYGPDTRLVVPSRIIRVDSDSLALETLVEYRSEFGAATTGLHVGDEIWVGAARDQGIARFTYNRDRPSE